MKLGKRWIAVLLAVCMLLPLTACKTNASQIRDTLSEFESACHSLDLRGMLRCIDPDISEPIRLGLGAVGALTGQDTNDLLDMAVKSVFGANYDPEEFLSRITVTDPKLKIKKKNATVDCKIGVELGGDTFQKGAVIRMRKVEDQWYISGIELKDHSDE